MTNPPPRIDRDDRPPDHIYVERIEKDKKEERESPPNQFRPDPSQVRVVDAFLIYLKKMMSIFSSDEQKRSEAFERTTFLQELVALRALLQVLSSSDESHNPAFILQVTAMWNKMTSDFSTIKKESIFWKQKLEELIREIDTYPPGEGYTLGYYLSHHAGEEWLPFPFMDMLQSLHLDTQQKKKLSQWINTLSDIISGLEE